MSVSGIGGTGLSASGLYVTGSPTTAAGKPLTAQDQAQIDALQKRDAVVKAHEKAHQTTGGSYAGAATYTYQQGPDGKKYAIGGEVSVDASPVPNNPKATIAKMQVVERAALAPAQPSSQDQHVAAEAANAITQAQTDAAKAANSTSGTGTAGQTQATGTSAGAANTTNTTNTNIVNTMATAAAAQDGGGSGLRALFARGLAAYGAAAGLGSTAPSSPQFAAVV